MNTPYGLKTKIFADGADLASLHELVQHDWIAGFTTNPTLMRQAGVRNYEAFAREAIALVGGRPISFEVFSDDFAEMHQQALHMASWGENVNVKIPVTNTKGESSAPLLKALAAQGVKMNVTALMTLGQVKSSAAALAGAPASFVSVFAGRIADTGRNPLPVMKEAMKILRPYPHLQLIWASPRELLNLVQADATGCHIITVTENLLKRLPFLGKDLDEFSLDTVRMFYNDALSAGFQLELKTNESIRNLADTLGPAAPVEMGEVASTEEVPVRNR